MLGAGSQKEDFAYRFPNQDLAVPIAAENALDDEVLQSYLESAHLDDIWSLIKELAMTAAEEQSQEEVARVQRYEEFVAVKDAEEEGEYEDEDDMEYGEDYIKEEDVDENDVVQGIEDLEQRIEHRTDDGDVGMDE